MLTRQKLEEFRLKGIDAHDSEAPRSANPYSYEASRAGDSGWMQAKADQKRKP